MIDHGVPASRLQLPPGEWATVLDCLCDRFPAISRERWLDRIARGRVLDAQGLPMQADRPYQVGLEIRYFREVEHERAIPFAEMVLSIDEHLLVVDKPHFLPVAPTGTHVEHTLLTRLRRRFDNADLVPLHRIDRETAGLVLFSTNPASRARYQALFRERRIEKTYHAIAPALPDVAFPLTRRSCLVRGEPFFRMREIDDTANTETRIDVLHRGARAWRYVLHPVSGRKHQLRVHMAALGAPILHDAWYPTLVPVSEADAFSRPLQLLAQALAFVDPLSGERRGFSSGFALATE